MKKNVDLTSGNIYGGLIKFCTPLFLSNLLTLMYNLVDTLIVGRFLGNKALAGVGSTGTLMFLMNGLMIGFTTGTSVITSRFFGAKDKESVKKSVATSVVLALTMAAVITVILFFTMPWILKLMNTKREFYDEAFEYITVISYGLVVMTVYKLLESMLRAIGISKMTLVFALVAFVSNILLDLLFIAVFKMGTGGAALATILSFGICAVLCFVYILKKAPILHIRLRHFKLQKDILKNQLKTALPMSAQHSLKGVGTAIVQSSYNLLGTSAVAAVAVATKLEHITTDAYTALGATIATFCSQNIGANKIKRINKGFKSALIIGLVYTVLSGGLLLVFSKNLVHLFVSKNTDEISQYVKTFMYLVAPFFSFLCVLVTLRYGILGLGFSNLALLTGAIELLARVIVSVIGGKTQSFVTITLSYPISWFVSAVAIVLIYRFYIMHSYNKKQNTD